jgi:hypothetical protein
MDMLQRRSVIAVIAFIVGFAVGLFIFGWGLTPLQFSGAGPQDLLPRYQESYIRSVADLYSHDLNQQRVRDAFEVWPEAPGAICRLASAAPNTPEAERLTAIALILNNVGCTPDVVEGATEEEGGSNLPLLCGLLLLALLVLGGLYYFFVRRPAGDEFDSRPTAVGSIPGETFSAVPETLDDDDVVATPIARFETRYSRGHDTYDDSFSIENAHGEFLGECGVGISETIGMDAPKNVTAFEVWLFDKNDIRTVTKVIMSEHAYRDQAIRAKLAPKGEPVLARENETIVLETATLIINAEITELAYGTGSLEPQSFFEHFTVELSAWAKEGDFDEPDVQGHIDQMLDF